MASSKLTKSALESRVDLISNQYQKQMSSIREWLQHQLNTYCPSDHKDLKFYKCKYLVTISESAYDPMFMIAEQDKSRFLADNGSYRCIAKFDNLADLTQKVMEVIEESTTEQN